MKKKIIEQWYARLGKERQMSYHDAQNTITKTLENLVDKGCLVGYGVRTPQKWFIHEIRLTPEGRRMAKKLRGVQQILPLQTQQ